MAFLLLRRGLNYKWNMLCIYTWSSSWSWTVLRTNDGKDGTLTGNDLANVGCPPLCPLGMWIPSSWPESKYNNLDIIFIF